MKSTTKKKKLSGILNKTTIAHMTSREMNHFGGGNTSTGDPCITVTCQTCESRCPSTCSECDTKPVDFGVTPRIN